MVTRKIQVHLLVKQRFCRPEELARVVAVCLYKFGVVVRSCSFNNIGNQVFLGLKI